MIKSAYKISTTDSQKDKVQMLGKSQSIVILRPYGLQSNAPANTFALVLAPECQEGSLVGLEGDIQNVDDLDDEEVAIGIPSITNRITFRTDGTIEINGSDDYAVAYTDLKSAFDQLVSDFNTLVTQYNTDMTAIAAGATAAIAASGLWTTELTIGGASSSSADMSDAKIDTVKVP